MGNNVQIFYSNYFIMAMSLGLLIIVYSNKSQSRFVRKYFLLIILNIMLLTCVDTIEYFVAKWPDTNVIRYITSSLGYFLRPLTIVLLIRVLTRRDKFNYKLWLPIIYLGLISFTSIFTKWLFYFVNNYWQTGPLYDTILLVNIFYMALMVYFTFKVNRYTYKGEKFVIFYIVILTLITYIIESKYSLVLTLPSSMIISTAMYYIFMCSQKHKYDDLTGLLNRTSFTIDLGHIHKQGQYIVSIDMNDLKLINDKKGHAYGDKALKYIANTISKNTDKRFKAYRIGGDEFMILCNRIDSQELETILSNINDKLKLNGISIAYGYAYYHNIKEADDSFKKADSKMYQHKQAYKTILN